MDQIGTIVLAPNRGLTWIAIFVIFLLIFFQIICGLFFSSFYLNDKQLYYISAFSPFRNFILTTAAIESNLQTVIGENNLPSLSVSFSVKGQLILNNAWGFSDLENKVYAEPDTKYRLASISKTFTALVMCKLKDNGKLSFDDLLEKYLDPAIYPLKYSDNKKMNITIGQLLDHTAGTHFTTSKDFDQIISTNTCTEMIHQFASEPLLFFPGSNFSYSNYGYQLLGAVIESVTGKSYPQVMTEFFSWLGLNSSYVEVNSLMVDKRARYYRQAEDFQTQNVPTLLIDEAFPNNGWWPSAGLMSTPHDLVKYGNLIIDTFKQRPNSLISYCTLKEMWTKRTENCLNYPWHPVSEYGYGWNIAHILETFNPNLKYRQFVWHSGNLMGVSTYIIIYPEQEIVGAVITNKGNVPNLDILLMSMAENLYPFYQ